MENMEKSLADQAAEIIENEFPLLEGIDDLADRLAVSKCHLIRCFSAQRGVSPGQYLISTRLEAVCAYLAREDYMLDIIAGLTGFSCGNYLCKVFRKAYGVTPRSYREGLRRQRSQPVRQPSRRSEDILFL